LQVEDDAQVHDLALAGRKGLQPLVEGGREAHILAERLRLPAGRIACAGPLLAASPPRVRTKPVESCRARDREQPGTGRSAARIEPPPLAQGRLEGLTRQ